MRIEFIDKGVYVLRVEGRKTHVVTHTDDGWPPVCNATVEPGEIEFRLGLGRVDEKDMCARCVKLKNLKW